MQCISRGKHPIAPQGAAHTAQQTITGSNNYKSPPR